MRNYLDLRHCPVEFEQAAWHVIPGGDEAQGYDSLAVASIALGLSRVAERYFRPRDRERCSRQPNFLRDFAPAKRSKSSRSTR